MKLKLQTWLPFYFILSLELVQVFIAIEIDLLTVSECIID